MKRSIYPDVDIEITPPPTNGGTGLITVSTSIRKPTGRGKFYFNEVAERIYVDSTRPLHECIASVMKNFIFRCHLWYEFGGFDPELKYHSGELAHKIDNGVITGKLSEKDRLKRLHPYLFETTIKK